jgi:hypothetical protein
VFDAMEYLTTTSDVMMSGEEAERSMTWARSVF